MVSTDMLSMTFFQLFSSSGHKQEHFEERNDERTTHLSLIATWQDFQISSEAAHIYYSVISVEDQCRTSFRQTLRRFFFFF